MADTMPFKRLMLRAVLRHVSSMIIRLISVSDHLSIDDFHDVFRAILGWSGDLGYIIVSSGEKWRQFQRNNAVPLTPLEGALARTR
jgi:hypothetical protein